MKLHCGDVQSNKSVFPVLSKCFYQPSGLLIILHSVLYVLYQIPLLEYRRRID